MEEPLHQAAAASLKAPANRYDRMEWAGVFGDLGTLIPFVAAYIGVLGLPPFGVLFAFGAAMLVCGLHYRTPFPVQPMKAIGAVASIQAVQTALVTPNAVYVAALATGAIWLLLGASGLMGRVARLIPTVVVAGIILGLGFGFMLQGAKMMSTNWPIAILAAAGTLVLLRNRMFPAMFALMAFAGVQLAPGTGPFPATRSKRIVLLVCAALCIWNVAAGLMAGLALAHLGRRGLLHL